MDGNRYLVEPWLLDDELDDAGRAVLAMYTVPRRALDGRSIWLADEVVGVADD